MPVIQPLRRDGTPVPGLTAPEVVGQLTWRVLGPLKGRAKSVLDWAGLRELPPGTQREVARRYFVTQRAVGQRVQRVAAEGARLQLSDALLEELSRPDLPGENPTVRRRCAYLLGVPDPPEPQ